MKILAHRGYWNKSIANNSAEAIRTALERGYGFESDVRDYMGEMVISHNIADSESQRAEKVFQWLAEFKDEYCFAINIKADGLKEHLLHLLKKYEIENYFTFDMSVPQMIEFDMAGIKYFTRQSEVESIPVMYERAAGIWIDCFFSEEWITEEVLKEHIQKGKQICLVSPDLHKRAYRDFWKELKGYQIDFDKVMLCTDYPDEAKCFFTEECR